MTSQKMCDCNQGRMACTCKPEEEHGLQASAAKQRIDAQAGALESQAREIERLTAAMQRVDDHYQAQKAQPSGVDERE